MAYIQEEIISGKVIEVTKRYDKNYQPIKSKHTKFKKNIIRQPKTNITTEQQERINYKNKELKLFRLLACNYKGGDFHLVLSYDNPPSTIEELKEDKKKFFRKLRDKYKKNNQILKYICVAEVGPRGAVHFHIIVNKIDTSIIEECWDKGFIKISLLHNNGQYKKLAAYLLKYTKSNKEEAKKLNGQAWSSSKNLKKPKVIRRIITRSEFFKDEISRSKRYENYYVEKDSIHSGFNEFTGYRYFKYMLVRKQ